MRLLSHGIVLSVAVAVLGMTGRAWSEPGDLLTIDLAKVADQQLAPGNWGEATTINDRACRVARSGKNAWVHGSAWWKEGLRPAEGQYFVAEVLYKDTATKPIIFSVWGGLGFYGNDGDGMTELHRFGGLNDGKWKVAQIPLGWDMVMLRPGTQMVEMGVQSKEGDVPVSTIRVLPLAKDKVAAASERWNAETRAWVRQVQAKDQQPRKEFDKSQQAPAAVNDGKQAVVPYVRTWMSTVYPYSAPQEGETGVPLKAQMAQNEYEPATFGVYAPKTDLTNVTVKVDGLRHESNAKAHLAVEVRTAEYALATNGKGVADFPLRLWPMYATQIKKGQSGWFWVTFKSDPKTTVPGLYHGKVVIKADQGTAALDVKVQVLPIDLVNMNDTDLTMGGCIAGMVSRHDMDEMLRHNHNVLQYWFSGVRPKFIVKDKGDFDLDFTVLDDQFEQARKAGIKANVWFLGGNPYGFPITQTLPRELARQVLGMTVKQYKDLMVKDPNNVPEVLVPLYKKWVAKVQQHAKEKGWPEQILTPFDEPAKWAQGPGRKEGNDPNVIGTGPWIKPQFEQCCQFIHEAAPGTRIYGSIHHAKPGIVFLKDVDIFCTNAVGEDPTLGDQVRKAHKVFWQYSGADAYSPAERARYTFGFYFASYNSRGSLCWAYNFFNDRFDNSSGNNWGYAWYTPTDMIPAPYYEGMREAWDDRRYIETLRKVGKAKNVNVEPFLQEIGKEALASRGKGGQDTVNDFWDQAKRVGVMDELRGKVAARIIEISTGKAGK